MNSYPRILPAGDAAVTVEFGAIIDPEINDLVLAFAGQLESLQVPGIIEVVPTYCSATVHVDPLRVDLEPLTERLAVLAQGASRRPVRPGHTVEIPVVYGDEFGPDLSAVAAYAKRSIEETIALHCSVDYRCYMLGFSPGFPYLGQVPDTIAMPRLAEPRATVPAGSVGIAGAQTGIYPQESPGGWRVIGRTPLQLYEPARSRPFLIEPGDRVRMVRIDREEFERLAPSPSPLPGGAREGTNPLAPHQGRGQR